MATPEQEQRTPATPKKRSKLSIFGKAYTIQFIIVIYMSSSVFSKFAALERFLSIEFFLLYGLAIGTIFLYALLWQLVLSQTDLSVAYSHKSMTVVWTMVASVVFFQEHIGLPMVIGAIFIIVGLYLVSTAGLDEAAEKPAATKGGEA